MGPVVAVEKVEAVGLDREACYVSMVLEAEVAEVAEVAKVVRRVQVVLVVEEPLLFTILEQVQER